MSRAVAGLILIVLAGCFTARPGTVVERLKPFGGPRGSDTIAVEVSLIEAPVGDSYLNDGLWSAADEQLLDLERKVLLEDNGFRVGVVGGILPAELLTLLTTQRSNPAPRLLSFQPGASRPVPLGGGPRALRFQLRADGKTTPVEFASADCTLHVTPTPEADGAIKLSFVPFIQHGAKASWTFPLEGGLPLHDQRSVQRYPFLSWEVTLSDTSFVLIGTRYDRTETLGHCCFIDAAGAKPVQRLLAIRASRFSPETLSRDNQKAACRDLRVTPLALQAIATVRGTLE